MKVVIFGATGLAGGAFIRRAIDEPAITSIVAVTRRELPGDLAKDPKVETVILKDFQSYPDDVVAKLSGCEGCLWSIGGRTSQFPDSKSARLANIDYLHTAAKMLAEKIAPELRGKRKFRFVYCSGSFTERDPTKKLYFLEESRKIKGEAENGLLEIEKEHSDIFEVFIGRPAGILETDSGVSNMFYGSQGIGKGNLAYALVDIALNGAKNQVTESVALRSRGSELAKKSKQKS